MDISSAQHQEPGLLHHGKPGSPSKEATRPAPVPGQPLPSAALLQGGKSVEILHNGAVYRLQATKLGKLILTK